MSKNENKKSFVFYESFKKTIDKIDDKDTQLMAYKTIIDYGLYETEPPSEPYEIGLIMEVFMPVIDKAKARYRTCRKNGSLGGAPKGNKNAEKKTTKIQPKNNLNDNDNDNDNKNENVNVNDNERLQELSNYLSKNYSKITINKITCDTSKQDFELIKQKISESNYLQSATLSFILENYDKVINDKYKNFDKVADDKDNFMHHNYTKEELNAMYDDPDDIEI